MNRVSIYRVRLGKIVSGGQRNICAYYLIFKAEKSLTKMISRAMRSDEENQDQVFGEVQIKVSECEIWNYDRMKMVEAFKVDFKMQPKYLFSLYQDNLQITIQRTNQFEEEMKKKYGESVSYNSLQNSVDQNKSSRQSVLSHQKDEVVSRASKGSLRKIEDILQIPPLPGKQNRISVSNIGLIGETKQNYGQ